MNRKVKSSFWSILGYLLSPFSFWNDLFFNIPLAYIFAIPFGFISRGYFLPAMIFGYWLTNVAGLILMHRGIKDFVSKKEENKYKTKDLIKDLGFSLIYTLLIVVLVKFKILKLPNIF